MNIKNQDLQREVFQLLQRKRRYGRSLTDNELKKFFKIGSFKKEKSIPSEALLSSSACLGAALSIEGENRALYTKSTSEVKR